MASIPGHDDAREREILASLRAAMARRVSAFSGDGELGLTFADPAAAEELHRALNRLVMDDIQVALMFDGYEAACGLIRRLVGTEENAGTS